jgi:hypothetical protein
MGEEREERLSEGREEVSATPERVRHGEGPHMHGEGEGSLGSGVGHGPLYS